MEQAFYRKYRPKDFDSAVGQEHITNTLKKAINSKRISHAYLFTGPRGVGKTSIARILAHEVNKLPYDGENVHLDIIEIDAASNRRIDEIRDLRDKVNIAPASADYKVYIIDEVHMLTKEAFNALLKTLEEPPAHCIFILATTEAHKLPETIISRTQRFEFKPVNVANVADHLANLAKKEKIDISREALELLADAGDGSFRDSIGYLDQLSSFGGEITGDDVRRILALPSSKDVGLLRKYVSEADLKNLASCLEGIQLKGVGAVELSNALAKQLREAIVMGTFHGFEASLLKQLTQIKSSTRPYDYLEALLLETAINRSDAALSSSTAYTPPGDKKISYDKTIKTKRPNKTSNADINQPIESRTFNLEMWDKVLENAKSQAASIYTALRLAEPVYKKGLLTLKFEYQLHQKKLSQAKNRALVADIIYSLCGQKLSIDTVFIKKMPNFGFDEQIPKDAPLHSISNVFGGAEMMEV